MAEKIKIFQLDIDVEAAIASQSKLKDTLDTSKQSLLDLKKAGDTSSKQYIELEASVKNLNREYNASQTQLGKLLTLQGKEIKTVKEGEAALTVINKEWAKQQQLFGTNSVEADKLAKKHAELKARTNELRKGIGDTSTNVGNYSEDMKEALGQSTLFAQGQRTLNTITGLFNPVLKMVKTNLMGVRVNFQAATAGVQGYSAAQKAAAIGTNLTSAALKLLKIALIATGIGAIVVVLGSLVAMFSKTQTGIDFVNKALAIMGAAFDVIIDRAAAVGGGLLKIFSGNFKEGFNDITGAAKGLGDELEREIRLVSELEDAKNKLRKEEIGLITTQAARKKQIEELRIQAKDELKDLGERAKLLDQAGQLEEKILEDQLKIAKEKARISQLDTDRANSTDEELKANEELQARVIELETESLKKRRSIETEKQSLQKRARAEEAAAAKARIAEAQKVTDAAIKESKTRLALFIEENKGKADSLQESISIEEQVRDKRLAILQEELEAKKLTQTEYELAVLETKNGFLEAQSNLTQEYADKEIEAEKEKLKKKQELQALELERKATDLENKMEIEAGNFEAQLELEKQRLEMQRQQELAEAEKTGADKALINKKYAQIDKDIEAEKQQFKRDVAAQTFANLANIFGKESAAGKAAAIAETTINTYSSATAAYKAMAGIPVVGPALGAIAAASAVASGIQSVRKIVSTPKPDVPKAAKGITLRGKSHSEGGERLYDEYGRPVVEAEGGENIYVLNKKASGMINSLSYLNQATGGVPLSQATNYAAAGGMIQRTASVSNSASASVDYDLMAEKLAGAYSALPSPKVAVTEINDGQGKYANVVNGANF